MHRLNKGHYIAPLLCSDSLPFAVGLELFIEDDSRQGTVSHDHSLPEMETEDLLSLQYILDGRGQVPPIINAWSVQPRMPWECVKRRCRCV